MTIRRIGFVLIDGYAMLSTAAALDPLRAANSFAGRDLYDVRILTPEGTLATSSLGARFDAIPLAEAGMAFDLVFVVAGGDPMRLRLPALDTWLRRADRAGVELGGISGGAVLLARAGLLEGRRFTVHWHHYDDIAHIDPTLLLERKLFVIDRDRYTCAGGSAPLDMIHMLIARDHGARFAHEISDWFIQAQVRPSETPQKSSIAARYGALPPMVEAALELMEAHIADPLSPAQLADLAGLSERQLQRQFNATLGAPVMEVYRHMRLDVARALVQRSALPLSEIAQMTGFASQAHFTTRYGARFGTPPQADRSHVQKR
ncbi:GlxA family transcriptional regulator [Thioclava sp. GXIMD4216]|uniref:GlxA family transcriptional regulator n=1 Tax=Thioclava sp. GXIMD4216 TaxID=3131929 RepID=UPI0030D100D2